MKVKKVLALATVSAAIVCRAAGAEMDDPNGGILERKDAVPSKQIGVIDLQKAIPADAFADAIRNLRIVTSLPFAPGEKSAPVKIEVGDEGSSVMILYPEEMRATVSVKALAADSPSAATLLERVQKTVARAGLYLMGSGYGPRGCLSSTVRSLKELDGLALDMPSPDALTRLRGGRTVGVKMLRFATYRQACRGGWAPPPTNDIQRAIWEQVKADKERGPTNAITIQPPNAKK